MKHESRIHKTIVCVFDMMSAFLMQCIVHTESNKNQTNNIYKPCIPCIVFPDTDLMFFIMFIHNMQCTFKYFYAGERLNYACRRFRNSGNFIVPSNQKNLC